MEFLDYFCRDYNSFPAVGITTFCVYSHLHAYLQYEIAWEADSGDISSRMSARDS